MIKKKKKKKRRKESPMIRAATKLLLGLSTHHLDIVWLSQINKCWHLEKNPSSGFTFRCRDPASVVEMPAISRRNFSKTPSYLLKAQCGRLSCPQWSESTLQTALVPSWLASPHDLISFLWCRDETESNYCGLKMLRTGPFNIINKCVHLLLTLKS